MDGLHVRVPALEVTYSKADRRFAAGCAESDGSAAACAVTQLELFVMAPMCVLLFAAYLKRWRCRDALELVLCALQRAAAASTLRSITLLQRAAAASTLRSIYVLHRAATLRVSTMDIPSSPSLNQT